MCHIRNFAQCFSLCPKCAAHTVACTRARFGGGCEPKRGRQLPPLAALTFCVFWGTLAGVLIYLFRDERTDNRALTMDVTGRNIAPVTS